MTKTEQNRVVAWRLKVLREASAAPRNVAQTCRHFGLSRKAFYKWKARYEAHGEAGLCDRPRAPHRSPRATPREVISKILYLRQRYHFGPGRIADYLQRFHQLKLARSSVHRILIRHGLNLLPASRKRSAGRAWRRYEKPQPGHRLQLDVKFLERIAGTGKRLYQFTAIDDCTRIRVLKVYDACNQTSAIRFVDEVIRRLPFRVLVIQTDNVLNASGHSSNGNGDPGRRANALDLLNSGTAPQPVVFRDRAGKPCLTIVDTRFSASRVIFTVPKTA